MKIPTLMVHPDEECHGLWEGPRKGRWIQAIYVIRGDTVAEWTHDYGPASQYKDIQPIMMPSYGENSVAQLQEHADKNREDTYWADRVKTMKGESTLIADVIQQDEEMKLQIKNKTVIGPYRTVQRTLHSQQKVREAIKEKRTKSGKRIY